MKRNFKLTLPEDEPQPVTNVALVKAQAMWREQAPVELRGLLDAVPFDAA